MADLFYDAFTPEEIARISAAERARTAGLVTDLGADPADKAWP